MSNQKSFRWLFILALLLCFSLPEIAFSQAGGGRVPGSGPASAGRVAAPGASAGGGLQNLRVQGRVRTLEGQAVGDAKVRLEFSDGHGPSKLIETDLGGHFEGDLQLKDTRHEELRVKVLVTKPGFEDARAETTLVPGRTPEIDVTILGVSDDPYQIPKEDLIQRLAPRLKSVRDELPDAARKQYSELAAGVLSEGDPAEVAAELEQLSDKNPSCVDCATLASLAMLQLGDWNALTRRVAQAAQANKKSAHPRPEPLLLAGAMESWRQHPRKAAASFQEALKLQPDDPLALQEMGRMQLQMNNDDQAEQFLARAVKAGASAESHLLLASAFMRTNDIPKAQSEMKLYIGDRDVRLLPLSSRMVINRLKMRSELASYGKVKTLLDEPLDKVVKDVPELEGIRPAESQAALPGILKKVGERVAEFFNNFPDTVSTENVDLALVKGDGKPVREFHQAFKYLLLAKADGKGVGLEEYRTDIHGSRAALEGVNQGFMLTGGFASLSIHLHPAYQSGSDFRLLGSQELDGHKAVVIEFAQNPERAQIYGAFYGQGITRTILLQGFVWVDPSTGNILRMKTELLKPLTDVQLLVERTEIRYSPVTFKTVAGKYWLPHEVVVDVVWKGKRLRNDHKYSEFSLFNVRTHESKRGKVLTPDSSDNEE